MTAQQGPVEKWTRYNHRFRGGTVNQNGNGNAICIACGADENDPRITMICLQGPIAEMLKTQAAAPSSGNDKLRRLRDILACQSGPAWSGDYQEAIKWAMSQVDRVAAEPEPSEPPEAAGELLLAVEAFVDYMDSDLFERGAIEPLVDRLRAAIAKARGGR